MYKFIRIIFAGSLLLSFALQFTSCKEEEPAPPLSITSFSPAKGDAGSTILIEGVSFSSNPANNLVSFGTTPATVTQATKTQLMVTVPAGIEKEKISVTVNNVSVASATDFIVTDIWKPIANYPKTAKSGPISFTINGKGYYGLGLSLTLKELWEYDPTNDTWTQKQDLTGEGRRDATRFVVNSKAYVIGGNNGVTQFDEVWEYNPASNNWTKKNSFIFLKRSAAFGFTHNSKGYIGGGFNYGSSDYGLHDFWEYDANADTWTRKADSPETLSNNTFNFTIGSYEYVGGGEDPITSVNFTFYQYDPSQDKWNQKSNLPEEIGYSIYGFGGDSKGYACGETNQLWQFDPAANTWTRKSDSPTYLSRLCGFSIGDYNYIVGFIVGASENAFRYANE